MFGYATFHVKYVLFLPFPHIVQQVTDVHPTRKHMIQFYRQIVNTSDFEKPIKWARENLLPFDRETYVQSLLSQHSFIPEDFRM